MSRSQYRPAYHLSPAHRGHSWRPRPIGLAHVSLDHECTTPSSFARKCCWMGFDFDAGAIPERAGSQV